MRNLLISSIALVSSTAFADEAPPITTTAARPSFTLMDPDGASNGIDLELGMTSFDHVQLWSQRLRGQAVSPNGIGGYATLQGFLATGDNVDSEYGLADMELGGLYRASLGPNVDASVRLGLTLPTAGHDLVAFVGMSGQRPSDLVLGLPEDAWLRAGGSLGFHQGHLFGRLDAGVDQRVTGDGDKSDNQLVHLNAGLGVGTAVWSAVAELQVLDEPHTDNSRAELVGVTAQYHTGKTSPYLGVSIAFDNPLALDGLLSVDTIWTISAGTRLLF